MKRDEKYHPRDRFLYALIFSGQRCYVGQSVGTRKRFAQHRKVWREPFTAVVLARMTGTKQEAEEHEYAWRLAAHRRGWRVYGAPGVLVDPTRRATSARWAMAKACTWPKGVQAPGRGRRWAWRAAGAAAVIGALAWGCIDGPLAPLSRPLFDEVARWLARF